MREPNLNPPEYQDLTDYCRHHDGQPLVGGHRECLLCVGRDEYESRVRVGESIDEPASFEEWLSEEYSGQELKGVELLRSCWDLVIRRFRFDTGLEGEKRTVKVVACAWCGLFESASVLKGVWAVRDSEYMVSHTMCGNCLEAQAAKEAAEDRAESWQDAAKEYAREVRCVHDRPRCEPCPPCDADGRGDWEYDRRRDAMEERR
jgi:hypothetical protein